ncbi:TPA: hypothetical protein GDO54_018500 [Pyxicephalus adspersus]|uniref:Transmembrane protein n=1 Tax=Pyxicephalus adspersus TaxID=30357 RepID=A0AAV2ZJ68_PYXAD|nr:TPA: hypothetical protein GDO54_018500 [Pyxicephalus adspersus]
MQFFYLGGWYYFWSGVGFELPTIFYSSLRYHCSNILSLRDTLRFYLEFGFRSQEKYICLLKYYMTSVKYSYRMPIIVVSRKANKKEVLFQYIVLRLLLFPYLLNLFLIIVQAQIFYMFNTINRIYNLR